MKPVSSLPGGLHGQRQALRRAARVLRLGRGPLDLLRRAARDRAGPQGPGARGLRRGALRPDRGRPRVLTVHRRGPPHGLGAPAHLRRAHLAAARAAPHARARPALPAARASGQGHQPRRPHHHRRPRPHVGHRRHARAHRRGGHVLGLHGRRPLQLRGRRAATSASAATASPRCSRSRRASPSSSAA